jgi:hypothetical protein
LVLKHVLFICIFFAVCGFNLNYDDEKPSDNIKNWRLHKLLV